MSKKAKIINPIKNKKIQRFITTGYLIRGGSWGMSKKTSTYRDISFHGTELKGFRICLKKR